MKRKLLFAVCGVFFLTASEAWAGETSLPVTEGKARLLVTQDGEVDDMNSLIHTLLYANDFDLEGIVQSSSKLHYSGDDQNEPLRWTGTDWMYDFMDAYEDLPEDLRRKRFNPLKPMRDLPDYEEICRSALMMMAADATCAFEQLPIVLDADILRNVLYPVANVLGVLSAAALVLFLISTVVRFKKRHDSDTAYDHLDLAEKRDYYTFLKYQKTE